MKNYIRYQEVIYIGQKVIYSIQDIIYIHRKSYILFRISYIFTENYIRYYIVIYIIQDVIYIIQDVINIQKVIYIIQNIIYIYRKLYKVLGSNNNISSLLYREKDIFIIENQEKEKAKRYYMSIPFKCVTCPNIIGWCAIIALHVMYKELLNK